MPFSCFTLVLGWLIAVKAAVSQVRCKTEDHHWSLKFPGHISTRGVFKFCFSTKILSIIFFLQIYLGRCSLSVLKLHLPSLASNWLMYILRNLIPAGKESNLLWIRQQKTRFSGKENSHLHNYKANCSSTLVILNSLDSGELCQGHFSKNSFRSLKVGGQLPWGVLVLPAGWRLCCHLGAGFFASLKVINSKHSSETLPALTYGHRKHPRAVSLLHAARGAVS